MTREQIGIDAVVVLAIAVAVFNIDIRLADGIGYYLGPANAVLHGKMLLVDISSQYGLLSIYALAGFFHFVPISYVNFSILNSILYVLGYSYIYIILRVWLKSQLIPILGILVIILQNYFIQGADPIAVPQVGFLRFGWFIPVMLVILLRHKLHLNLLRGLEVLLVAIAFFWGVDSGMYVLGAYVAFLVVESLPSIRLVVYRLLQVTSSLLVVFIAITVFTFLRSYQWPNWTEYVQYALTYSSGGIGMLPMPVVGTYLGFLAVYVIIAGYVIINLFEGQKESLSLAVITFMTTYGILQFIYYVGRSHPNNLHNVIIPLIIVVCWCIQKGLKRYTQLDFVTISINVLVPTVVAITILCALPFVVIRGKTLDTNQYLYFLENQRSSVAESVEAVRQTSEDRVAIVSMVDTFFLVEGGKTNFITDSDNFLQQVTTAQVTEIAEMLLTKRPSTIFIDHDHTNDYNMFSVPIIYKAITINKDYRLSANVGYLDEYVLMESK